MSAPQSAVAVCPAPNAPFRAEVRPDDRVAVDRIVRSTGFFHDHEISIAVELVEERLAKGEASGYHFLFADEAGQAVGYACYGEIPCTTGSYDLYWIAVADEQRGRGLGKRLLAACEADIVARQGRMIYIETSTRPQYQPTRKFYLACGYQQVAVFDDFYAPGDGTVVFGRRVAAGG